MSTYRATRAVALELRNFQLQLPLPSKRRALAQYLPYKPLLAQSPQSSRRRLHTGSTRAQQAQEGVSPAAADANETFDNGGMTFGEAFDPSESPKPQRIRKRDRRDIEVPLDQFQGAEKKLNHFPQRKRLVIGLNDQHVHFDCVFLRDACRCPKCLDPSTKQKLFRTTDIHPLVFAKHISVREGRLHIMWSDPELMERAKLSRMTARREGNTWLASENGAESKEAAAGHHSIYDFEFLNRYSSPRKMVREQFNDWRQVLWGRREMESDVLRMDYEEYMSSDEALWKFVQHMSVYGLAFVKGVPEGANQDSVGRVCERIGNLKDTFYGRTWDVKNVPDPKNIAYTAKNLGLHMDLLYFESPPGLQFLHCLRNSATGGASVFADSFRAAHTLRLQSSEHFRTLTKFPVPFHYDNDGRHYHFLRPTVVVEKPAQTYFAREEHYRISHVNYAPPFQAPFELDHTGERVGGPEWRKFVAAFKMFVDQVEEPENQYETLLRPGECAVFANRRVLHARRAFDPMSGERWLKGAYIDIDVFRSAFRVLAKTFAKTGEDKAIGCDEEGEVGSDVGGL